MIKFYEATIFSPRGNVNFIAKGELSSIKKIWRTLITNMNLRNWRKDPPRLRIC